MDAMSGNRQQGFMGVCSVGPIQDHTPNLGLPATCVNLSTGLPPSCVQEYKQQAARGILALESLQEPYMIGCASWALKAVLVLNGPAKGHAVAGKPEGHGTLNMTTV